MTFCDFHVFYLQSSWAMLLFNHFHVHKEVMQSLLWRLSTISNTPFTYITSMPIVFSGQHWYDHSSDSGKKIAAIEFDGQEQDFLLFPQECTIGLHIAHEHFHTLSAIQNSLKTLFESEFLVRLISGCEGFKLQPASPPPKAITSHQIMDMKYLQAYRMDEALMRDLIEVSETSSTLLEKTQLSSRPRVFDIIYLLDDVVDLAVISMRMRLIHREVTKFILIESNVHFHGERKGLRWHQRVKKYFASFEHQIIYISVDSLPHQLPSNKLERRNNLDFILNSVNAIFTEDLEPRDNDLLMISMGNDILELEAFHAARKILNGIPSMTTDRFYGKYVLAGLTSIHNHLKCFETINDIDRDETTIVFPSIISKFKFAKEIVAAMGMNNDTLASSIIRHFYWLGNKAMFYTLPHAGWRIFSIDSLHDIISSPIKNDVLNSFQRNPFSLLLGHTLSFHHDSKLQDWMMKKEEKFDCETSNAPTQKFLQLLFLEATR